MVIGFLVFVIVVGNMVIVKFFEYMLYILVVVWEIVEVVFELEEVVVVEGVVEIVFELLKLFFNYIFFIGVLVIGKIVMWVVVEYLILVMLELGGKLLIIVDEIVDFKVVVCCIVWGKFLNSG